MSLLQTTGRTTAGILGRESWLVRRLRPLYESFLDWASFGKGIPWPINNVSYRIDPRHRHRLGQNYDAQVAAYLRERVQPGAVCLDVGANVGVYVLQFAHWAGPTGRVIAFEPNPAARAVLQKHVKMNALTSQVKIVPAAIGASCGEAELYAADADGMSRLGEPNELIAARTTKMTVALTTLDAYCELEDLKPDWLFIDIEGFEIAALKGARRLIKSRGEKLGIIVEMHPGFWRSTGVTLDDAKSLLDELRLRAIPLTGQSDALNDYGLVALTPLDAP
jgi:FkbM family methyltransferase